MFAEVVREAGRKENQREREERERRERERDFVKSNSMTPYIHESVFFSLTFHLCACLREGGRERLRTCAREREVREEDA